MGTGEGKALCWVRVTTRLLVDEVPPRVAKAFNQEDAKRVVAVKLYTVVSAL